MRFVVVWAVLAILGLASSPFDPILRLFSRVVVSHNHLQERAVPDGNVNPVRQGNFTQQEIHSAQTIVDEALDKLEELNKARLASPSRNQYRPRPDGRPAATAEEPAFKMTNELAAAAFLVAELDSSSGFTVASANATHEAPESRAEAAAAFWMQGMKQKGSWPWGTNAGNHVVRESLLPQML
jgi:hypothetical protein